MHISWNFLDKRKATVDAIEAYRSMEYIIRNTDDEINQLRADMGSASAVNLDGMPHAHNPQASEEALIAKIDEIDIIKERYRQAVEYMEWFKPAWERLSEDDRYVLELFYMDCTPGAAEMVADHFNIERKTAYVRKTRAETRLCILLYGKS